jgi:hypothetical protein
LLPGFSFSLSLSLFLFSFFNFCDLENLAIYFQQLAKLLEFTLEKTKLPNFFPRKTANFFLLEIKLFPFFFGGPLLFPFPPPHSCFLFPFFLFFLFFFLPSSLFSFFFFLFFFLFFLFLLSFSCCFILLFDSKASPHLALTPLP